MVYLFFLAITLFILSVSGTLIFRRAKMQVVPEDYVAITVDRDGFIRRVLPAGRHLLHPFETIGFIVDTRTRLASGRATAMATNDGLLINVNWSGNYSLDSDLITEQTSQRLRGLPNAHQAISRNVDICLRSLVGSFAVEDLFKPATRERIERQLSFLVADRLRALGIVLSSLNLQVIELPTEVAEAINKARAIKTLDGAICRLDPTTREVVRGVLQLDEILHWDAYLPTPSRLTMKRLAAEPR